MSPGLRPWQIALGACGAAWVATRLADLDAIGTPTGMALVSLVPGLAVLRLMGFARRPALWLLLAAGATSAPVMAGAIVLAAPSGLSVKALGEVLLGLFALIVAWPEKRHAPEAGEPLEPDHAERSREQTRVLLLGAALALLVAIGDGNPRIRVWSDSWFHAAIFQEVGRAGIPPEFPHFAGNPLPYPWFFHVYLAGIRGLVGSDPFVLMAALNVWTALLFPLGVYAMARAFGLSAAACRWSAIAGVLGTNPFGLVGWLVKGLVGETRGLAELARGVADCNSVLIAFCYHFPFFQTSLLGRLWTPTAYNFGLLLVMLLVTLLAEIWRRPRARDVALFALAFLLLLHWHTFTAIAIGIGIAAGVALATLAELKRDAKAALRRAATVGLAALAAALLTRPYFRMVTVGAAAGRMFEVHPLTSNLFGLLFSMGPAALAGAIGWRRLPAERRPLVGGMLLGAAVPFLLFDVPGITEEKFYYPLFLILVACAGEAISLAWSRPGVPRAAVAISLAAALASAAVMSAAFIGDHTPLRSMILPLTPGAPAFLTADERAALRWMRERSPRDAVFLQSPRPYGTEPLIVFGQRRIYLGMAESFYRGISFPSPGHPPAPPAIWDELGRREALQLAAFSDRELAADSLRMIRAAPWPLYLWWDASLGGGALSPSLHPEAGVTRTAFTTPTVRILEVTRGSASPAEVR